MLEVRQRVMQCLSEHAADDENLIRALNNVIAEEGIQAYPVIFHILTHLDLAPEKAKECWDRIIDHRQAMSEALGREVNLRTAVCDYFCSISRTLKNPIVVEIHVFENKANSYKFDGLTGLYTRAFFDETLEREIARSKRYESELSIIFFDLDDFKKINDRHGHQAGDKILKTVAEVIMSEIRTEDFPARYGGEEIVVILPQTGKLRAFVMGERIRERVASLRVKHENKTIEATVSGGLASFPIDATDVMNLIRYADKALYNAKGAGKNTIALYSQDKRRYFRVDFAAPVTVRKIGFEDSRNLAGSGKNMSLAGILFETDTALSIHDKVQIQVPMAPSSPPLLLIGTVVRVESYPEGRFDIGVSFIDMDKKTHDEISGYLMRHLEMSYL